MFSVLRPSGRAQFPFPSPHRVAIFKAFIRRTVWGADYSPENMLKYHLGEC